MWRQRFILALTLIALTLASALVACQPSEPNPAPALTVTDARGRTITLPAPPQRIAIVGRANFMIADAVYMFPEAKDRVVAISGTPQGDIFQALVDPHLREKTRLERDPGPEQIASVHPDLVLMKSFLAEKLGRSVEALGIPVLYMSLETPEAYTREIHTLGTLFRNEHRAREITEFYKNHTHAVTERVQHLEENEKPSVLVLQHTTRGGTTAYKIPPLSWIQTTMVRLVGAQVAWSDATLGSRWTVITMEQIAAWNPDIIYIVDYFGNPEEAVAEFLHDPTSHHLKAVQNHRVHAFPKDVVSWDQPDTRWILGLTWLAYHTHPRLFHDVDAEQLYLDFYQTLYLLDEDTVRDTLMPLIVGDWP